MTACEQHAGGDRVSNGEDLSQLKIDKTAAVMRPRKRRRALYLLGTAAVLVAAGILYATGYLTPSVDVEVATVSQMYPSQGFTLLNASGYVVAQRKAAVASKTTGRLVTISVEEGNKVKKGDIIARLESDDVQAAKDEAAANLVLAQSTLEQVKAELIDAKHSHDRNRELLGKGYISQAEYDASEARYHKARAAVGAAEAGISSSAAALRAATVALEYTLIRAPFDAVVLTKNADIGDIVTPIGAAANAKAAVVTIADMGSLQVEADVSESNLRQVAVGQPCEIQLDALPESRFRGAVHMIVPTADRAKATVLIKVKFLDSDSRILPEMSAKVAFLERIATPDEQRPRTVINPGAIITRDGKRSVFVIREGRAVETEITVGENLGDMIAVSKGVSTGEKVILKPLDKVRDHSKVKVIEK